MGRIGECFMLIVKATGDLVTAGGCTGGFSVPGVDLMMSLVRFAAGLIGSDSSNDR